MNPVDMGIGWAQRAVYEALTSDGGITVDSTTVPVRADVMPNQQPPYILLTNRAEDRWNVHSGLGSEVIIAVEVITRGNGHYERAQLHEIMNQVRARLDHQGIQITAQTYPPIPAPITATFDSVAMPDVGDATEGLRGLGAAGLLTSNQRAIVLWANIAEYNRALMAFGKGDWATRYMFFGQTNATTVSLYTADGVSGRIKTFTTPSVSLGWHCYILYMYSTNAAYLSVDGEPYITGVNANPFLPFTYTADIDRIIFQANGTDRSQFALYNAPWTDNDTVAYFEDLPLEPRDLTTWKTPTHDESPIVYYPFLQGDDRLTDAMENVDLELGEGITLTATERNYLPPDYEPEPTPVPPETVPTINGCLFESALIIDEPDGETLRGESRYRIYLRAPSGD